ncbi:hypothetical protein FJK98_02480 [Micromonospora sp. HM134]|uniref:hypothetical protein n=1 Tax=Micromonospora sp. HM134 TaxID=2583243 RepID=UPI0011984206|nr:hypothetical protein [Micromonospora sp. HM134]QDY06168.1 hypothetical protein FJK98_02480 [Micromonospora sp. HM134]
MAEPSLAVHRPLGWMRVSEYTADKDSLDVGAYADAPDLDAEPQEPAADSAPDKPGARTQKAEPTAGKREN